MNHKKYSLLTILAGLVLACGQAQATVLDNWNDTDLGASGDYIEVIIGEDSGNTWFSLEWMAGGGNQLQALGIDTIFYNCTNCSTTSQPTEDSSPGDLTKVFVGNTAGTSGTDISSDWAFNFGGETGGGGFGTFSSRKNLNGGGTDGVGNILTFLLNGAVNFIMNSNDATFDAHVRYEEGCSGWASDGESSSTDSGSCGAEVPEPTPLLLLSLGLGLVGFSRWLFSLRRS